MNATLSPTRRTRGFTLLEVMLAMLLATVLLAAVWVAVRMELRFFEAGRSEVEQAQLARAIVIRLRADLDNAVAAPMPPEPSHLARISPQSEVTVGDSSNKSEAANGTAAVEATTVPPAASGSPAAEPLGGAPSADPGSDVPAVWPERGHFRGTSTAMSFDTRMPPESFRWLEPTVSGVASTSPQLINLRTVRYMFVPGEMVQDSQTLASQDPLDASLEPPSGLVRWEAKWTDELRASEIAFVPMTPGATGQAADAVGSSFETTGGPDDPFFSDNPAEDPQASMTQMPEVAAVEFRYFDGAVWHSQWDSRWSETWPEAVHVAVRFVREPTDDSDDFGASESTTSLPDPANTPLTADALSEQAEADFWDYRLLIPLRGVPTRKKPPESTSEAVQEGSGTQ